jgi:hypothetical protein
MTLYGRFSFGMHRPYSRSPLWAAGSRGVVRQRCGHVVAQRRYGMLCTSGVPSDTGTLTGYRTIGVRTCYCCSQAATRER